MWGLLGHIFTPPMLVVYFIALMAIEKCVSQRQLENARKMRVYEWTVQRLRVVLSGDWPRIKEEWYRKALPEGVLEMTSVYQKYLNGLAESKRSEIIDKLLDNQMVRCQQEGITSTNISELIEYMGPLEVETLYCLIHSQALNWGSLDKITFGRSELANDIIAFRFRNPY